MRDRTLALLLVVVLLTIAAVGLHTHFILEGCDQTLLWTADDAYLFVDTTTFGYDFTYLGYALERVEEYFGAPGPSTHRNTKVTVIHITPTTIKRTTIENLSLDLYTATALGIFANRQGTIVRWSGTTFEPAPADQQVAFRKLLFEAPREFEHREGWSKKVGLSGYDGENAYNLPLSGAPASLSVRAFHGQDRIEFNLARSNQPVQQIHVCKQGPRHVSTSEYDRNFQ